MADSPQPPTDQSRKAKNHRKRHVPPGPAGIYFQSLQGKEQNDEDGQVLEKNRGKPISSVAAVYSPAWMAMQLDLKIVTPSLPAYLPSTERYQKLRPHVPSEYILLPQILGGESDWKLQKSLLVLVERIHTLHGDASSWTVQASDETGADITLWMEPSLVVKEMQHPKYLRLGLVWRIEHATVLLKPEDENNNLDRMLLVAEDNIKSYWEPMPEDDNQAYLKWMERRSSLSQSIAANNSEVLDQINKDNSGDESEEDEELEMDWDTIVQAEASAASQSIQTNARQSSITIHMEATRPTSSTTNPYSSFSKQIDQSASKQNGQQREESAGQGREKGQDKVLPTSNHSNDLSRFEAPSQPLKPRNTPLQAPDRAKIASPKKSSLQTPTPVVPSEKVKSQKSTSGRKKARRKSPKPAPKTNLFANANDSILGLFEDSDEDDPLTEKHDKSNVESSKAATNSQNQCLSQEEEGGLFCATNLLGIDMDELFDDDDD